MAFHAAQNERKKAGLFTDKERAHHQNMQDALVEKRRALPLGPNPHVCPYNGTKWLNRTDCFLYIRKHYPDSYLAKEKAPAGRARKGPDTTKYNEIHNLLVENGEEELISEHYAQYLRLHDIHHQSPVCSV